MITKTISGNENTTKLLNFLKTSKTQYSSLNKKQEQELIHKYKNNRDKLNKLLFMHNIKLVFNIAKKYMSKTNDFDGLVQDGMIGLSEAVSRFDITKDIKFCTYAYIWIKKYMTMNFYGKQIEVDKRSTSLDMPNLCSALKSNNGNEVTFENYVNEFIDPTCASLKTISDELSSNEQRTICNDLLSILKDDNSLSATDKAIFVDMFYNKEKPKDLSLKYNVTVQDISHIKTSILTKFKDILKSQYHIQTYADIS